jgi:hypothetical protein
VIKKTKFEKKNGSAQKFFIKKRKYGEKITRPMRRFPLPTPIALRLPPAKGDLSAGGDPDHFRGWILYADVRAGLTDDDDAITVSQTRPRPGLHGESSRTYSVFIFQGRFQLSSLLRTSWMHEMMLLSHLFFAEFR